MELAFLHTDTAFKERLGFFFSLGCKFAFALSLKTYRRWRLCKCDLEDGHDRATSFKVNVAIHSVYTHT